MILTKTVMYRGKPKAVEDLGPNSNYKVCVMCPVCGGVRIVYHRSILAAGHCICHSCINRLRRERTVPPGTVFSRLTVIRPAKVTGRSVCRCECGSLITVRNTSLRSGRTRSCGCLREETFRVTEKVRGERHGRWKGGVSSLRDRDMSSLHYRRWRQGVFERDGYTCQICGQWGRSLNAHHIQNYSEYPGDRYDIDNGVTLCSECHKVFHDKFGRKSDAAQFKAFVAERGGILWLAETL